MIFRFDTINNKSAGETTRKSTRIRAKRLSKDLREALSDKATLTSPAVSTVAITITAVTVYPY